VHNNHLALCLLAVFAFFVSHNLDAAEGGSSNYLQGTYGDFAAGMLGPQGVYVRNELVYYDASVPFNALGRNVDGHIAQAVWGDLLKIAYISNYTFLGGRYNAAIAIPVLFGSKVTVNVDGRAPRVADDGDVSGLGDIYFSPAALGWNWGHHHLNANISFVAPTGGYDDARIINVGRNYWSFDPTVNYTWLHPQRGHEVTLTLGYLRNWENRDADYTTGDELHLDWTIAQNFSAHWAVGLTGYWYEQTTDDTGALPSGFTAADFDAKGFGIGAAILYTPTIAGRDVSLVAKWLKDTRADQRLDGDVLMLALAFKL